MPFVVVPGTRPEHRAGFRGGSVPSLVFGRDETLGAKRRSGTTPQLELESFVGTLGTGKNVNAELSALVRRPL